MTTEFTPFASLAGGLLIGLSVMVLFIMNGRIAGISGILSSILPPNIDQGKLVSSVAFLLGLIIAIPIFTSLNGIAPVQHITSNAFLLSAGGFCVGIGSILGSGCTSGHGVCGLARLSKRSIVATLVFMISAMVTLYIIRHIIGV